MATVTDAPTSLKLVEFADRELLLIVWDLQGRKEEGATTVGEVSMKLGLDHPHPERCVSSRFSWLKRWGIMEQDGSTWRLSDAGRQVALGEMRRTIHQALAGLREEELLGATRELTRLFRYQRNTAGVGATLMRREWVFGTWKDRNGSST